MNAPAAPFIPVWFDEVNLSPLAFRVLAHLWRRANSERECWPGVSSIAASCGVRKTDTVHRVLNELEAACLMVRVTRAGTSNIYRLVIPPRGIPRETGQPAEGVTTYPAGQDTRCPAERDTGIPRETGHKGTPHEGSPKKVPQEGSQNSIVFPLTLNSEAFRKAWDDYLAYRREAKMRPLKPRSVTAKLDEMAAWGEDSAIQAIRDTIRNGWQGLFEPRAAQPAGPRQYAGMSPSDPILARRQAF